MAASRRFSTRLAAAYAEAGRFSEAVRVGRTALDLAGMQKNEPLAKKIQARLRLYMAKTPYRQPANWRSTGS